MMLKKKDCNPVDFFNKELAVFSQVSLPVNSIQLYEHEKLYIVPVAYFLSNVFNGPYFCLYQCFVILELSSC